MYMGVILTRAGFTDEDFCAPHVYGGDPIP